MSKDYHKVLGVTKEATEEDIKKAYRRLAILFHPDKNTDQGAEEKFKEISEAYKVLSDEGRKTTYDGRDGLGKHWMGRSRHRSGTGFSTDPHDFFRSFFGDPGMLHQTHSAMFQHHLQHHRNLHNNLQQNHRVHHHDIQHSHLDDDYPIKLENIFLPHSIFSQASFHTQMFKDHLSTNAFSSKPTRTIPIIIEDMNNKQNTRKSKQIN
eukprot:GFUD01019654.1.p1 GENE.GFUD01019654.1~~GFUD01019654.1.p1  ORF type:complete len:208 (+),score=48.49 GFUD01019654.1:74-697(+)